MKTREELLQSGNLRTTIITAGDWGEVRLRQLDLPGLVEFQSCTIPPKAEEMARLVVRTVVDDEGNPMFTDADIPALMQKSGDVIAPIFIAVGELNRITNKVIEDAEKNLTPSQSELPSIN